MVDQPHGRGRRRDLEASFHLGQDDPAAWTQSEAFADLLGNHDPTARIDGCEHGLTIPSRAFPTPSVTRPDSPLRSARLAQHFYFAP